MYYSNNLFHTFRFITILCCFVLVGCKKKSTLAAEESYFQLIKVKPKLLLNDPSNVKFEGKIGQEMDKILEQRILSELARKEIIPEATEAFTTKMDDQFLTKGEKRGIWQGEFWGKWMLSAIATYHYTGDKNLKNTIKTETENLIATQREDGYIGTYRNSDLVEGNVWNVWCRKYTLWGLVESYELLQEPKFLEAAQKHMDHLMTEVGPGKVEIIKTGNFVGLPSSSILTPLVKLYLHSGKRKYLEYAEYIVDNWESEPGNPPSLVKKGLEGQPVHLWFPAAGKWTKAYEFISCVEGLLDLYEVTGKKDYLSASINIYKSIKENERVITGGIGYHDKLVGAANMADGLNEPCDVVYWERLSAKLLVLTADQSYADEIEILTYNTLMGAFNLNGDWGLRRMGLNEPHLVAPLHCYTKHHHCCVANIPRGMLQLTQIAVMPSTERDEIMINLFIPGDYQVEVANGGILSFHLQTDYPKSGEVSISFKNTTPVEANLRFRKPEWCSNYLLNGELVNKSSDNMISSQWKAGDKIKIQMDITSRWIELPEQPEYKAIMKGPLVLARTSKLEGEVIDEPIEFSVFQKLRLKEVESEVSWFQYELIPENGKHIQLIDYSSTGKNYQKPDDPQAIKAMLKNNVGNDQRVWFKINN